MPASADITLTGCSQHNLRHLDVSFPPDAITVVTGPSGAGKSSLVFGTLHAESRRRYLESLSTAERSQLDEVAPPQLDSAENLPLTIAIRSNSLSTGSRNTVGTECGLLAPLQVLFASSAEGSCPACGHLVQSWQPQDILVELESLPENLRLQLGFPFLKDADFQDAAGWLTAAGFQRVILNDRVLSLEELKQEQGTPTVPLVVLVDRLKTGSSNQSRLRESLETCYRAGRGKCELFAEGVPVNPDWTACNLDSQAWSHRRFTRDRDCLSCGRSMLDPLPALFRWTSPLGACPTCLGRGLVKLEKTRGSGKKPSETTTCPACDGSRLNPDARGYRLHGASLPELQALTIQEFGNWVNQNLRNHLLQDELTRRITLLSQFGLAQLPLDTLTSRLSDAEQISLALTNAATDPLPGALYLIEEPFCGRLSPEWPAIREVIDQLQTSGAGACLVQARSDIFHQVDSFRPQQIFRLGPGSGDQGGQLVEEGESDELSAEIPPQKQATPPKEPIHIQNIAWPWMKETEISLIAGGINVLSGIAQTRVVALLREVLTPALAGEQLRHEQSITLNCDLPFGQTQSLTTESRSPHPRQIVAAAVQAFGGIRTTITETDDAKKRNLTAKDLSLFNREGARCLRCEGTGRIGVDFDFLPEFELKCPECGGTRYDSRVGEIRFRGLTLPEILELTAEEAFRVFKGYHPIQRKMQLLKQVRLGYLRLGQSLTEMSRGERQRLRLAAALGKIRGARTLLLAEELSWGLATNELPSLLAVLKEFTTAGHSVLLVDAHEFWEQNSDHFVKLSPAE